jgi:hypothetical protein
LFPPYLSGQRLALHLHLFHPSAPVSAELKQVQIDEAGADSAVASPGWQIRVCQLSV